MFTLNERSIFLVPRFKYAMNPLVIYAFSKTWVKVISITDYIFLGLGELYLITIVEMPLEHKLS
jgi:hypothetical protein